ncbi:CU044_5270 family protein [Streptomyces sp. NPDC002018]|uniref:CU044_5270 family protein n=1 Tax=Streptomyces sp. NPDC002018 TaxID=3364629 RepID=UPI0036929042
MNANPSRQTPAEWEESAQLLPSAERDLPAGRHQFHKERLMARIQLQQQERPTEDRTGGDRTAARGDAPARRFPRSLRGMTVLPAMALALAGAVVLGGAVVGVRMYGTDTDGGGGGTGGSGRGVASGPLLTTRIGTGTTEGVPQLLDQISLAAADGSTPSVGPGQYVYIESLTANTHERTVDDRTSLVSDELHPRRIWKSADGTRGWLIDPAVNDGPEGETLSLPDEKGDVPVAHMGAPSYDFLAALPTDPDVLLAKIYRDTRGQGNSPDQQAFTTIGDLLSESYPPAELYSALFRAAAKIPGVVRVPDAVDAAGRHGVAVARLDETSGQRMEWIFDEKTHVYLGERSVQVRANGGDGGLIRPGTVVYTSAIMNRAVVNGIKETPTASAPTGTTSG